MNADVDFRILVDWEDPGGVRTPELRATWCRLEMWVGDECVTRVEEAATNAARRSIYVPLYPLAEWIAYNWWYLQAHHRPAVASSPQRTYARLLADRSSRNAWLRNHNLRSAGEGFPWPDLTIVPEGDSTRLTWHKNGHLDRGGLRYITSGDALVDGAALRSTLTNVVELALTRCNEAGLNDTQLHEEWNANQILDADESAFCEASARLGLDPFNTDQQLANALVEAADALRQDLLVDFLNAVDPRRITETMMWVNEAADAISELTAPGQADLSELRSAVAAPALETATTRDPWILGLSQARAARDYLGLDRLAPVNIGDLVSEAVRPSGVRQVDGYGTSQDGLRLVLGRAATSTAARFAGARALWHGLNDSVGAPFLLTRAHTVRQKAERAFAAELLAPAAGIKDLLGDVGALYDSEDVAAIARHYAVQPILIEHQIENNVDLMA